MEKEKSAPQAVEISLKKLDLNANRNSKSSQLVPSLHSSKLRFEKKKPPSLVSLCLGVIGRHLEDIIEELNEIAVSFPADIKIALVAIARRRKLLSDDVIISLADSSWEILDLSGSEVSDFGLAKVAEMCKFLRAVDISQCKNITANGVSELVQHCHSLETLRCGGCPSSESTARRSLGILKPKLNDVEGDSWEELDTMEIGHGAQSLRWLVWPKIDKDSLEMVSTESPRIIVNPKPSLFGFRGTEVPREAFSDVALDEPFVRDIDPKTWVICRFTPKAISQALSSPNELSVAEKFRLAFVERDTRLAPKRAKNARQHQRRAEREWVMGSTTAKALALASKASKSLHGRS
ncbi:Leucine-rich repeat, cysteine-containing subtype [Corchorus capsularis]|uniref:Leucine-rich repeat, cysteine-containing subtype n=1 Tax=Corchorus capsularis TaxID=210143 RepID=A0A1R3ILN5_COCAP|nr:Leucine-rich repeat, cysteine-containing subtype [Corchorus capsularis]